LSGIGKFPLPTFSKDANTRRIPAVSVLESASSVYGSLPSAGRTTQKSRLPANGSSGLLSG